MQILVHLFLMNILELFLYEYLRDFYPLAAFHKSAAHFSHLEIPAVKELGFSSVAAMFMLQMFIIYSKLNLRKKIVWVCF